MAAYAAGGAAAAAALCAGITGCGICIGGITALALIPLYIRKSDSSDNGPTSLPPGNTTLEPITAALLALAVHSDLMASGSRNGEIKTTQQENATKQEKTTKQEQTTQQTKTTKLTLETSNEANWTNSVTNLTTNASSIASNKTYADTDLKIFTAVIIFISFLNKMLYF